MLEPDPTIARRRRGISAGLALAALCAAGGCGQKGPLHLPEPLAAEKPAAPAAAAPQTPAAPRAAQPSSAPSSAQ